MPSFHDDLVGKCRIPGYWVGTWSFQMGKEAHFRHCILSDPFLSTLLLFSDPQLTLNLTLRAALVVAGGYIRSHSSRRSLAQDKTPFYPEITHLVSGPLVWHPLFWLHRLLGSAPDPLSSLLTWVCIAGICLPVSAELPWDLICVLPHLPHVAIHIQRERISVLESVALPEN